VAVVRLAIVPVSAQAPVPISVDTTTPTTQPAATPETAEHGPTAVFLRDVGRDYLHFLSIDTAIWLGMGGGAALAVHPADDALRDDALTAHPDLSGGDLYGEGGVQIPLAVAWWIIGHAAHSERGADVGRDLLRAQISAASWTYALKFATHRTRPNGDPRSLPSGHASATFATAMVLEEHYGWKVGVPAFAAAAYTAASRVTDNKHWASDVVLGAFLGMAPTGKPVQMGAIDVWLVRDGKLAEAWHVEQLLQMMMQIGAMPAAK
jgi:hypothetical protein